MSIVPGSTIGHYSVLAKIGSGGMGDVWRARDTRLEREVALKVLPPEPAESEEHRARFVREARAIAALNHPNIVTVHSVEECDGLHFITMELVTGKTLAELLPGGGFALEHYFNIALPLVDAVASAHDQGVIHRDLKPGNVMITGEGRLKVLDFGLAKLTQTPDAVQAATELTQRGVAMGTLPYMSPEQIQGSEVDHRADIFALGILLYEMAAGTRPFVADSQPALMYAILQDVPTPLFSLRAEIPGRLCEIVERCLAKQPGERFQKARELHCELNTVQKLVASGEKPARTGPAAVTGSASIAVLPFDNMSPDPNDEFFSDGITEEIITVLSQLKGLRVAARTSSFAFKGKQEDLRQVAEKLGVQTVLEGSVRKAGTKLRITAQLINAADGYHMWSERYDREFNDIFAIQDEIAGAIADELRVELMGKESHHPPRQPRNMEAYELFLKGRVLHARRGMALLESQACFERAVELDPELSEAHALLADTYRLLSIYGIKPAHEMMPAARAAAERSLASTPDQVEGLATLASIHAFYDVDIESALDIWRRALEHEPGHVRSLMERALMVAVLKPTARTEALQDSFHATQIDSLNAWAAGMHAFVLAFCGRKDEAIEQARAATELDRENFIAHWALVDTLLYADRFDEGLTASQPALTMSGRHPLILTAVAGAYAAMDNLEAADAIYQELVGRSRTGYIGAGYLAPVAASAGRQDEAREHARQAVEERDPYLIFWRDLPGWAQFRADSERVRIFEAAGL